MGYSVAFNAAFTDSALKVENARKITLSGMEHGFCEFIKSDPNLKSLSKEPNVMLLLNDALWSSSSVCSYSNEICYCATSKALRISDDLILLNSWVY